MTVVAVPGVGHAVEFFHDASPVIAFRFTDGFPPRPFKLFLFFLVGAEEGLARNVKRKSRGRVPRADGFEPFPSSGSPFVAKLGEPLVPPGKTPTEWGFTATITTTTTTTATAPSSWWAENFGGRT